MQSHRGSAVSTQRPSRLERHVRGTANRERSNVFTAFGAVASWLLSGDTEAELTNGDVSWISWAYRQQVAPTWGVGTESLPWGTSGSELKDLRGQILGFPKLLFLHHVWSLLNTRMLSPTTLENRWLSNHTFKLIENLEGAFTFSFLLV